MALKNQPLHQARGAKILQGLVRANGYPATATVSTTLLAISWQAGVVVVAMPRCRQTYLRQHLCQQHRDVRGIFALCSNGQDREDVQWSGRDLPIWDACQAAPRANAVIELDRKPGARLIWNLARNAWLRGLTVALAVQYPHRPGLPAGLISVPRLTRAICCLMCLLSARPNWPPGPLIMLGVEGRRVLRPSLVGGIYVATPCGTKSLNRIQY